MPTVVKQRCGICKHIFEVGKSKYRIRNERVCLQCFSDYLDQAEKENFTDVGVDKDWETQWVINRT